MVATRKVTLDKKNTGTPSKSGSLNHKEDIQCSSTSRRSRRLSGVIAQSEVLSSSRRTSNIGQEASGIPPLNEAPNLPLTPGHSTSVSSSGKEFNDVKTSNLYKTGTPRRSRRLSGTVPEAIAVPVAGSTGKRRLSSTFNNVPLNPKESIDTGETLLNKNDKVVDIYCSAKKKILADESEVVQTPRTRRSSHSLQIPCSISEADTLPSLEKVDISISNDKTDNKCKTELPIIQENEELPIIQGNEELPIIQENEELPIIQENEELPIIQENEELPIIQENEELPIIQENEELPIIQENEELPIIQEKEDLTNNELFKETSKMEVDINEHMDKSEAEEMVMIDECINDKIGDRRTFSKSNGNHLSAAILDDPNNVTMTDLSVSKQLPETESTKSISMLSNFNEKRVGGRNMQDSNKDVCLNDINATAKSENDVPYKNTLKLDVIRNIPRGIPKSGRWWKTEKNRFSSMIQVKPMKTSWAKKMQKRDERKELMAAVATIKEDKRIKQEQLRERQKLNKERKEINARKSEVVQVINDPRKLKQMKKKQLRMVQKRDTSSVA